MSPSVVHADIRHFSWPTAGPAGVTLEMVPLPGVREAGIPAIAVRSRNRVSSAHL